MNAESFLTTKYTSFNISRTKNRSSSFQNKSLDNTRLLPSSKELVERKQQRYSLHLPSYQNQLIALSQLFSKTIIEQLIWRQSDLFLQQFKIQISYVVDYGNLQQFGAIICLCADILLKIKDYNNACYYYNQYRILNTLTKNHAEKAKALIGIANCACDIKMHQEALILLKKALQYSWLGKEYELIIYERMALNYYYLGQMEEQHYFHERGLLGIFESDESPIKQFSCESLRDQIKKSITEIKSVCPQLLNLLNLPILSRNELPSKNPQTIRGYETKKQVIYPVQEQIEIILQRNEEFEFKINTPKYQKIEIYTKSKKGEEFRYAIQSTNFKKERRAYDIRDTTVYKLPYETQVANRIKYPYMPEDINLKLQDQLRNTNRSLKFGLRNKVMLNHQHREEMHYRKNGACLYRQLQAIQQQYSHLFN